MVTYFIYSHACYVPKTSQYRNPNVQLLFDTPLDSESCSKEYILDFDKTKFNDRESYMNPKKDYILSFKDDTFSSSTTSVKLFGVFDEKHQRVEIKNITNGLYFDILLSNLIEFLVPRNTPSKIYCAFCRNPCDLQTPVPNKIDGLEYGIAEMEAQQQQEMDDFDYSAFDDMDVGMDTDINNVDYGNVFENELTGGKRQKRTKKRRNKRRQKRTKRMRPRSRKSNKKSRK